MYSRECYSVLFYDLSLSKALSIQEEMSVNPGGNLEIFPCSPMNSISMLIK